MKQSANITNCPHGRHLRQWVALLTALTVMLLAVSCGKKQSTDQTMTEALITEYMNGLCKYDISAMNKTRLSKLDAYGDGKDVNAACRLLASRIQWQSDAVSINGNSAIAQITVALPADFDGICRDALGDTLLKLEQGSEKTPAELLRDAMDSRAEKAEITDISMEISMNKIDNKWYIVQSNRVDGIISDIRTPVAAVYSMIDQ